MIAVNWLTADHAYVKPPVTKTPPPLTNPRADADHLGTDTHGRPGRAVRGAGEPLRVQLLRRDPCHQPTR